MCVRVCVCARLCVCLCVCVFGMKDRVTAHVVPGDTPFLLSKGLLAKWGVIQVFRSAMANFVDRKDKECVELNEKGHLVFDLRSSTARPCS